MLLNEQRKQLEKGSIPKQQYIEEMYNKHSVLFEYATYLKDTSIEKIEIINGNVILTERGSKASFFCKSGDMRLPPIEALNFGAYEPEESVMMFRLIKSGMNIFDIGANIGWFSIQFAMQDTANQVYAFEPIPDTFSWLKKNAELNAVSNLELNNFGLSNEIGEIEFFAYPEGSAGASMANNSKRSSVEKVTCFIERMDDFCDRRQVYPDFIKCDVEGAELFVFQGGESVISKYHPIVFTEMLRKWAASFNYHPNEIIEWFSAIEYKCYEISGDSLVPFCEMDEKTTSTNFVFLHPVKHQDVMLALT